MDQVVVLLSGGMDSATLLFHLQKAGHPLRAISFNYGQRHEREIEAASRIARVAEVEHIVADLRGIAPLFGASALTSRAMAVPHGHYQEESMKQTIVPNRNMIMLSVATAWAISSQFDAVAYAAHSGDHAIYPDCRPEFADALDRAVQLCDWRPIKLLRPFVTIDKGDIAQRGKELGVPHHLTWTCYEGGKLHCGKCGACRERKEAFAKHGVNDPTVYEPAS